MAATLLILIPLVGGLLVWLLPLSRANTIALTSIVLLAEGVFWLVGLLEITRGAGLSDLSVRLRSWDVVDPQLGTTWEWFREIGASYAVGFHGFQYWLTGMAILVFVCAISFGVWVGRDRPRAYFGLMLFTLGAVVGVFAAQDLLLFYVFFEAMLIPLYILVGVWGGPNRGRATLMFVLYTMAGSLLMLAAVIAFGVTTGSFALDFPGTVTSDNDLIFLGFAAAFAVKAPLLPFHGWMRTAYTEAPPEVAAVLSGVVSKAAAVGFFSICALRFPQVIYTIDETGQRLTTTGHIVLVLAALTLLYGSLLAFRQPNIRSVVAYSSMAQMGLITIGMLSVNFIGATGGALQAVNHGLVSSAMFLLAGILIQRAGTDELSALGGMAKGRPLLATVVMVVGMIVLAVPGAATFTGEFAILTSIFNVGWGYAAVGAFAIVLAALYGLRLISAVLHVARGTAVAADRPGDLDRRELSFVLPLVVALVLLSAWPALVTGNSLPNDEQEQPG
ncbi:MAG: NuoM family protein [Gaiella sp.]